MVGLEDFQSARMSPRVKSWREIAIHRDYCTTKLRVTVSSTPPGLYALKSSILDYRSYLENKIKVVIRRKKVIANQRHNLLTDSLFSSSFSLHVTSSSSSTVIATILDTFGNRQNYFCSSLRFLFETGLDKQREFNVIFDIRGTRLTTALTPLISSQFHEPWASGASRFPRRNRGHLRNTLSARAVITRPAKQERLG